MPALVRGFAEAAVLEFDPFAEALGAEGLAASPLRTDVTLVRASEQEAEHDAGGSSADDAAGRCERGSWRGVHDGLRVASGGWGVKVRSCADGDAARMAVLRARREEGLVAGGSAGLSAVVERTRFGWGTWVQQ